MRPRHRSPSCVIISSVRPSVKYSCPAASLRLVKGSTANLTRGWPPPGSSVSSAAVPMKRYPRRGSVSTNLGLSASSPSAARSRFTAALRLCSKSTNVPFGQRWRASSSRVTTSPGRSSIRRRISNGCSCRRIRCLPFRSSRDRTSSSKDSNRRRRWASIGNYLRGDTGRVWQAIPGHQRFTSCHLQCIEALGEATHSGFVRNAITFAVAMALVAIPISVAQAASDSTPDLAARTETHIQVRVYNAAVMPVADQAVALRAAAVTLAAAGIGTRWLPCGDVAPKATAKVCDTPLDRSELSVRLVRLPGTTSVHGELQLGYSLVDITAGAGTLATIYADRVAWLANATETDMPTLVGLAMAHEIGHLLLGTNAHSRTGLMRAVWSRAELQRNVAADWRFGRSEAARMRSSIRRLEGLRI